MLNKLLSKKYYPALTVLALLILFSAGLFWYGERTMRVASQGYTVLAFQDPSDTLLRCSKEIKLSSLNFFIHNQEKETYDYQIIARVAEKEVVGWKETVPMGAREVVKLNKLALPKISQELTRELYADSLCSTGRILAFEISWDQGKKQETLSKKINFQ
jgi:hypothetical protein